MSARSVLLVDDDGMVRRVLAEGLVRAGYVVIEAGDGDAAIRLAEAHSPDAAVLDLSLPGLDGISLARLLRVSRGATRLVACSGKVDLGDVEIVLTDLFDGFLHKPVDPFELAAEVGRVLSGDPPADGRMA